jgi:hypothetical protein
LNSCQCVTAACSRKKKNLKLILTYRIGLSFSTLTSTNLNERVHI